MYIGSSSAANFDLQTGHLLPMARENPQGSFGALLTNITNTTFFCWRLVFSNIKNKMQNVEHASLPCSIIKTLKVNEAFISKYSFEQNGIYTLIITTAEKRKLKREASKKKY